MLPSPPLPEQAAIAKYLDDKTEQIDKLIAGKRRLIALLKEERSAVINNAVTRGINPHAKLKPSGIDWLGEIPEHWEVKRLKFLSKIKTGEKNTEDRIEEGEYPFFVRSQEVERINSYSFDGEAILTAGDGVGVAKVFHYYNGKFDYHQRVYKLSHFSEIQGKLLFYFIRANLYKEVLKWNAKSTVDSLRLPMFQNFMVTYPKAIDEQIQIIQFIEAETDEIDATIAKIEKEIEYLREYRTALISEVVTGKIDVRQAEATANVVPMRAPANSYFRRTVLTAEIVHQLYLHPMFGHVKLMKLLYLAEHHGQLPEIESQYYRQAAGPYDYKLLGSVEKQMAQNKWYRVIGDKGEQHRYLPLEKAGTHHKYYNDFWGEKRDVIQWLIDLFRDFNTQRCEIVATLYAAWNDFLIAGKAVSDNGIINEVLTNWHDEKQLIADRQWRNALAWMREKGLVPIGFGKPTRHSPPIRRKK